jgi:hypothetical protein
MPHLSAHMSSHSKMSRIHIEETKQITEQYVAQPSLLTNKITQKNHGQAILQFVSSDSFLENGFRAGCFHGFFCLFLLYFMLLSSIVSMYYFCN